MSNLNATASQKDFAKVLYQAYTSRTALGQQKYAHTVTSVEDAYKVQFELMKLKKEAVGGYKVSLTSKETQDMFDSDCPLYGAQVESHFLSSPADFSDKPLMSPLTEVEMVFTAKEDLSGSDSLEELMKKTTVAPGIEVPDSRFSDWFPSLSKYLVVSDAAVGGYVVYGKEQDTTAVFKNPADVATVTCKLFHDDKKLKDGAATEVLGNPLTSLHWLAGKLEEQGLKLKKGQRVSSGTFLLPEKLSAGTWRAEFTHNMGSVQLHVK